MNINTSQLHTLWLENAEGDVWLYPDGEPPGSEPEGFIYQHSKFPCRLTHTILRGVLREEVDACDHPAADVRKTYGWIDGMEGRECARCSGTQVKAEAEPWPEAWDAHGSRQLMAGSSGYPRELALALARPSIRDRLRAALRGYFRLPAYPLDVAIRIAADACERCLNSLLHRYGQGDGYREFSAQWHKARTSCEFCGDACD